MILETVVIMAALGISAAVVIDIRRSEKGTDKTQKRADLPHFESLNADGRKDCQNRFGKKDADNPAGECTDDCAEEGVYEKHSCDNKSVG